MTPKKQRLDDILIQRGLAPNRDMAGRYIMAGEVWLKTQRLTQPGRLYPADLPLELRRTDQDVSRGAKKLRSALPHFQTEIVGRSAVDLGASTGGFTQVLLNQGAARVYAFDVGRGILHESLRDSPQVEVCEGMNLKEWDSRWVPEPFSLIVGDLSFIGIRRVLPTILSDAQPEKNRPGGECDAIILMKPQFEVSQEEASRSNGVIRDPSIHQRLLEEFRGWVPAPGWQWIADCPSALQGTKGNQEFFLHYRKSTES